jgi:hypothetical protein
MAEIPVTSHKDCSVLIGLQTAKGVEATALFIIPLFEEFTLGVNPNFSMLQAGNNNRGISHYFSTGAEITGKLALPLYPGYTGVGDLYDWMWALQDDAASFQGYWATVWKGIGVGLSTEVVEKYVDVRVTGGTVNIEHGSPYLKLDITLEGCAPPVTDTWPGDGDDALLSLVPYRFAEASFTTDGGANSFTNNHKLEFDIKLDKLKVLDGSEVATPNMVNAEWLDWKGTFDQVYVSDTIRTAFLAKTESSYVATLASGGNTATFTMARTIYTEGNVNPGNEGVVKQNGIGFQALSSLTDLTAAGMPCVIAESGA